ncbi:MAG: hypothetical protein ACRDE2_00060 [Chitinophagaceae bacterium]
MATEKIKLDLEKNYNFLFLIILGVVATSLIISIVKDSKKNDQPGTTPISDAIKAIKSGEIKTNNVN